MKETLKIVLESDADVPIPYLTCQLMALLESRTGISDFYESEKTTYNQLLLSKEADITAKTAASADPLLAALQFAMAGNFIDFGAFKTVSSDEVLSVLDCTEDAKIDPDTYAAFCNDLENASSLAYLADNAGEIVLDKLFVSVLKQFYPRLEVRFFVRGLPTLNDVTMHDAVEVGLDRITQIYTNGKAIPGTCLEYMDSDTAQLIKGADIVISKGQGNFESMNGTGLNTYYILLCKCSYFARRLNLERCEGIFINEKDVEEYSYI